MENEKSNNYQPLSFDTYKFFVKFSSYVEKIILNNINRYSLQNNTLSSETKTGISKLEKDFIIPENIINTLNINLCTNNEIIFNSK